MICPAAMVPGLERGEVVGMAFAGRFLVGFAGTLLECDDADEVQDAFRDLAHRAWARSGWHADCVWIHADGRVEGLSWDEAHLELPGEVTACSTRTR